jgi:polyisoprenoid-binding protein YceI
LSQTNTNLQDDSKDKEKVTGSAKFSFPLKPVFLSLQTQLAESNNLTANSTTGIKTKTRKKTYKFGVTYPLASWLILAYSRKLEDQESNLINTDYKKNSNSLQLTMIF